MSDDQRPTTDQPPTNQSVFVSVKDAATRLGITENAVRLRIKRNTLPAQKIGDNWFVVVGDQPSTNDSSTNATTSDESQPTTSEWSRPTTSDDSLTDQSIIATERIRTELHAMRDEWVQPFVDQLRELERERGRAEAERDAATQRAIQAEQERDTLRSRVSELEARNEAHVIEKEEAPQEQPQRVWWRFWQRGDV